MGATCGHCALPVSREAQCTRTDCPLRKPPEARVPRYAEDARGSGRTTTMVQGLPPGGSIVLVHCRETAEHIRALVVATHGTEFSKTVAIRVARTIEEEEFVLRAYYKDIPVFRDHYLLETRQKVAATVDPQITVTLNVDLLNQKLDRMVRGFDEVRRLAARLPRTGSALVSCAEPKAPLPAEPVSHAAPKAPAPPGPWHRPPVGIYQIEIAVFPAEDQPWALIGGIGPSQRVERFGTFLELQSALWLFADKMLFGHPRGDV